MFDGIISSFTQAIKKNGFNVAIFMLLGFLIWQVTNHIPTQIKEVKQNITRLEGRMDGQYKELKQELKEDINRLEDKMDKRMDGLEDKIDKLIFHFMGDKPQK